MIDREYCRMMARYSRWVNEPLYALCAKLPDAERKRDHRDRRAVAPRHHPD